MKSKVEKNMISICLVTEYFRCDACLQLRETLMCIRSLIEKNANIATDMRQRLLYRLNHGIQSINDWKKHLLRTLHQDAARKHVLDMLDRESVFLVADWAMKWLPTK